MPGKKGGGAVPSEPQTISRGLDSAKNEIVELDKKGRVGNILEWLDKGVLPLKKRGIGEYQEESKGVANAIAAFIYRKVTDQSQRDKIDEAMIQQLLQKIQIQINDLQEKIKAQATWLGGGIGRDRSMDYVISPRQRDDVIRTIETQIIESVAKEINKKIEAERQAEEAEKARKAAVEKARIEAEQAMMAEEERNSKIVEDEEKIRARDREVFPVALAGEKGEELQKLARSVRKSKAIEAKQLQIELCKQSKFATKLLALLKTDDYIKAAKISRLQALRSGARVNERNAIADHLTQLALGKLIDGFGASWIQRLEEHEADFLAMNFAEKVKGSCDEFLEANKSLSSADKVVAAFTDPKDKMALSINQELSDSFAEEASKHYSLRKRMEELVELRKSHESKFSNLRAELAKAIESRVPAIGNDSILSLRGTYWRERDGLAQGLSELILIKVAEKVRESSIELLRPDLMTLIDGFITENKDTIDDFLRKNTGLVTSETADRLFSDAAFISAIEGKIEESLVEKLKKIDEKFEGKEKLISSLPSPRELEATSALALEDISKEEPVTREASEALVDLSFTLSPAIQKMLASLALEKADEHPEIIAGLIGVKSVDDLVKKKVATMSLKFSDISESLPKVMPLETGYLGIGTYQREMEGFANALTYFLCNKYIDDETEVDKELVIEAIVSTVKTHQLEISQVLHDRGLFAAKTGVWSGIGYERAFGLFFSSELSEPRQVFARTFYKELTKGLSKKLTEKIVGENLLPAAEEERTGVLFIVSPKQKFTKERDALVRLVSSALFKNPSDEFIKKCLKKGFLTKFSMHVAENPELIKLLDGVSKSVPGLLTSGGIGAKGVESRLESNSQSSILHDLVRNLRKFSESASAPAVSAASLAIKDAPPPPRVAVALSEVVVVPPSVPELAVAELQDVAGILRPIAPLVAPAAPEPPPAEAVEALPLVEPAAPEPPAEAVEAPPLVADDLHAASVVADVPEPPAEAVVAPLVASAAPVVSKLPQQRQKEEIIKIFIGLINDKKFINQVRANPSGVLEALTEKAPKKLKKLYQKQGFRELIKEKSNEIFKSLKIDAKNMSFSLAKEFVKGILLTVVLPITLCFAGGVAFKKGQPKEFFKNLLPVVTRPGFSFVESVRLRRSLNQAIKASIDK